MVLIIKLGLLFLPNLYICGFMRYGRHRITLLLHCCLCRLSILTYTPVCLYVCSQSEFGIYEHRIKHIYYHGDTT